MGIEELLFGTKPIKAALYADDVNFIETALQAVDLLGCPDRRMFDEVTAIVFKPDALVVHAIKPAMEFLQQHGFCPIAWKSFVYDRNMIRNVWRYQMNISTGERFRVVDQLLVGREAVYILLRKSSRTSCSASAELTALKGTAHLSGRMKSSLRSVLGDHNTFLNKIHVPDDTVDLLRELSVYFSYPERQKLLRTIASKDSKHIDVTYLIEQVECQHPLQTFNIKAVVQSMCAAVKAEELEPTLREALAEAITSLSDEHPIGHDAITLLLENAQLFQEWELSVLLTQYVTANRPLTKKIL